MKKKNWNFLRVGSESGPEVGSGSTISQNGSADPHQKLNSPFFIKLVKLTFVMKPLTPDVSPPPTYRP